MLILKIIYTEFYLDSRQAFISRKVVAASPQVNAEELWREKVQRSDHLNNRLALKKRILISGLVLALLASALFFLTRKNDIIQPKAITEKVNIDIPQSTINIPITLEIKSLADYLNNKITGEFLNTTLFLQKSKKERIALTLTKTADITISSTGRELVCILPLTVEATLIDSRFGKTLSMLVQPFRTSIIMTLSTPINLDRSWKLKTRFKIRGYQWVTELCTQGLPSH